MRPGILELLRMEKIREALEPGKRVRGFQMKLQAAKNGDDIEISGFFIGRKPPNAPGDAMYCILSPIPPSELVNLSANDFRTYLVLRITPETTKISGEVKPGSYVVVKGIIDAYPFGTLRMVHVQEIEGRDYSEYWEDYKEFALSRREIVSLFERTIYLRSEMQKALLYSLYGVPYILGVELDTQFSKWGEGFDFTVYKYKEDSGLLALWEALRYFYSNLPWEIRFHSNKKAVLKVDDPLLGIDFRLGSPSNRKMKYYVPRNKKELSKLPKRVESSISNKELIGLLPENKEPDPTDILAKISETPFVLIPEEEKPYFENNKEFIQLIPNLIVTISINRERLKSMDIGKLSPLREEFMEWIEEGRREYPETFGSLSGTPEGLFNIKRRYYLNTRVFGAAARFYGRPTRRIVREVREVNEAILNDWAVVIKDHPELLMKLERDYEKYVSRDVRTQRALNVFRDLSATSVTGEVTREEFINELLRRGFKYRDAEKTVEKLILAGYIYEPVSGKLRSIEW